MVVEFVSGALARREWKNHYAAWIDVDATVERRFQRAQFHIHSMEENDAFQRAKEYQSDIDNRVT